MKLLRAHGLGNDYLVLEEGAALTPSIVTAICDRHTGVGSDGILEPMDGRDADYGVRIWNPDGSIAEKSGNGLRIFARWLHEVRGAADAFSVWTGHDTVWCEVDEQAITIGMGRARCALDTVDVGPGLEGVVVDLGNPHFVVFRTEPLDELPWRAWGSALETHPRFPNRTNVQFARIDDGLHARIWERGAGETQASGSSACAVAAAAVHTGRVDAGVHRITMPGGELTVTVTDAGEVTLRGPVELVARITLWPGFADRVQNVRE